MLQLADVFTHRLKHVSEYLNSTIVYTAAPYERTVVPFWMMSTKILPTLW